MDTFYSLALLSLSISVGLLFIRVVLFRDAGKVKCDTCKCWLDRDDAHHVILVNYGDDGSGKYYCGQHKKPYDMKMLPLFLQEEIYYFSFSPDSRGRVNEDGTPYEEKKKK